MSRDDKFDEVISSRVESPICVGDLLSQSQVHTDDWDEVKIDVFVGWLNDFDLLDDRMYL
jgi:hypothetical protein